MLLSTTVSSLRRLSPRASLRNVRRSVATTTSRAAATNRSFHAAALLLVGTGAASLYYNNKHTQLEALNIVGTPTKEPVTGITFPQLCNGFYLAGVGVRVKYLFVNVYAVATYMDPVSLNSVSDYESALLDPVHYPRTIRIVMHRNLSMEKYTAAIVESLEPRMHGTDLQALEEFKSLNPNIDLEQGAVMEMTIRGDTLLYKNSVGGMGTIKSLAFTKALCDTYYGKDPVSPTHKASVLQGLAKL